MNPVNNQKIEDIISTTSKSRAIITLLSLIEIEGLDNDTLGWICQILHGYTSSIESELNNILTNG